MSDLLEIKKRLSVFFKNEPTLVNKYIEVYGADLNMKNINAIRQDYINRSSPIIEEQVGENPIYQIKLKCPVCRTEDIEGNELKAKSQLIYNDPFQTPLYKGNPPFYTCNFTSYSITICPKCLFASPDKKDFSYFNHQSKSFVASKMSHNTLSDLLDTMGERMTIFEDFSQNHLLFHFPRGPEQTIQSLKLALERIKIESRNNEPFSLYKKGFYWLKIALIERQLGDDDETSLAEALSAFEEAFLKSDFPSPNIEYQTCYIIFAIHLRFGEEKQARDYMGSMERIKTDLEKLSNKRSDLVVLNQWIDKAKDMWEDKDNSDLWKLPKEPK